MAPASDNASAPQLHLDTGSSASQLFLLNDHLHQTLIEKLDPAVWRRKPPGTVRPIAAIFTHIHNVRCKWLRLSAPFLAISPQLQRSHCTPQQAREALAASAEGCAEMLAEAFAARPNRVEFFRRDALARPSPINLQVLAYMLTHEAHHRGQVCLLAHQLGSPLPAAVGAALWRWEALPRSNSSKNPPAI